MIPDYVREFMDIPGTAVVASRDAQLQPWCIRVFGAQTHSDQKTVTFYISELRSEQMIANFEDNGRVALTLASPASGDSYQLKGKYISWRKNNEQDDQFLDGYQANVVELMKPMALEMGMPEEYLPYFNMVVYKPSVAITFETETVFGQAPHPETGKLISGE